MNDTFTLPLESRHKNEVHRKVLLVAYYFPPLGMGGTQRLAKWCKYLAREGWHVSVVTVKPIIYYAHDESLLEDLGKPTIIRTGSLDPGRVFHLLRKKRAPVQSTQRKRGALFYWFLIPDPRILWVPFAVWHAWREIRRKRISFIVTSGPPHSSHLVGWLLSRVTKIFWAADFRDTWLLDETTQAPTRLHRYLHRVLEKLITHKAHILTAVSTGLLQKLEQTGDRKSGTSFFLPNGYDEEDFAAPVCKAGHRFEVAFVGSISSFVNPESLLIGFRAFVETAQLTPEEARLKFVGADLTGEMNARVAKNELQAFVTLTGYVPHAQAIAALTSADILVYSINPGTGETIVPGKTFEYLAARKPVLVIGEKIEGMQILMKHLPCRHCRFDAVDDIAAALLAFFTEFRKGVLPKAPPPPVDFSRSHQAAQLAAILSESRQIRNCFSHKSGNPTE